MGKDKRAVRCIMNKHHEESERVEEWHSASPDESLRLSVSAKRVYAECQSGAVRESGTDGGQRRDVF